MKPLLLLAALAVILGCATVQPVASPATPTPAEPAPLPPRSLLRPAPLTSVLLPEPAKPLVTLRLLFQVGSADDPPGKEGLTALTTALLSQGGTQTLSSAELLRALYPMAAELSANPGREMTVFHGRVHRDHLERFFPIFTDVVISPRFDPREFARLKEDALNEIRTGLRGMSDEALGQAALQATLYPKGHPYHHPEVGTVKGVESITLDDVKAHYRRMFTQDRLVIGLAGAVDAKLESALKQRLSALPKTGAAPVVIPAATDQAGQVLILRKPEALSTAISIGHAYPLRRGDADFFAVAFALSYLGEHRQSNGVLFRELRERRGLNYGDYAYAEHFEQESDATYPKTNLIQTQQDFTLWIRPVEPARAPFAVHAALYFLRRLVQQPIPAADFQRARGFLIGYTRLWEQTDARRLGYALDALFTGVPSYLDAFRSAMQEMTPEGVQTAVSRQLKPEHLAFAFVAPDADTLAQTLRTRTPLEEGPGVAPDLQAADEEINALVLPIQSQDIHTAPSTEFMEQ